jgi:hypothetical protein
VSTSLRPTGDHDGAVTSAGLSCLVITTGKDCCDSGSISRFRPLSSRSDLLLKTDLFDGAVRRHVAAYHWGSGR